MIRPTANVSTEILYNGDQIGDLYDVLDTLHSAASEGKIQTLTTMNEQELVGLLRDIIFTAKETIGEIENRRKKAHPQPILRFVTNKDAEELRA
jgi:hypothetical protein